MFKAHYHRGLPGRALAQGNLTGWGLSICNWGMEGKKKTNKCSHCVHALQNFSLGLRPKHEKVSLALETVKSLNTVDQAAGRSDIAVMEQNEAYGGSAVVGVQDQFPHRVRKV